VPGCTYPLTAPRCVNRIYTDVATLEVTAGGLVVQDLSGISYGDLAARLGIDLIDARNVRE
jgi:3-oxoadipate CoA-transferase beta subunit